MGIGSVVNKTGSRVNKVGRLSFLFRRRGKRGSRQKVQEAGLCQMKVFKEK